MKKKNGFVFMETIVVVSVLSITLIMLFASYSFILRKAREKNTFDTTETIYKTHYVKEIIDSFKPVNNPSIGVEYFINTHLKQNNGMCEKMGAFNSYVCDLTGNAGDLNQIKLAFEVEKIYYLNPREILTSASKNTWLNLFDATTIDYINDLGESVDYKILIVKYKKTYNRNDGTYEIVHSSVEVTS